MIQILESIGPSPSAASSALQWVWRQSLLSASLLLPTCCCGWGFIVWPTQTFAHVKVHHVGCIWKPVENREFLSFLRLSTNLLSAIGKWRLIRNHESDYSWVWHSGTRIHPKTMCIAWSSQQMVTTTWSPLNDSFLIYKFGFVVKCFGGHKKLASAKCIGNQKKWTGKKSRLSFWETALFAWNQWKETTKEKGKVNNEQIEQRDEERNKEWTGLANKHTSQQTSQEANATNKHTHTQAI